MHVKVRVEKGSEKEENLKSCMHVKVKVRKNKMTNLAMHVKVKVKK